MTAWVSTIIIDPFEPERKRAEQLATKLDHCVFGLVIERGARFRSTRRKTQPDFLYRLFRRQKKKRRILWRLIWSRLPRRSRCSGFLPSAALGSSTEARKSIFRLAQI